MTALHAHASNDLSAEGPVPDVDESEAIRERLYRAVIGENNTDYYIEQFTLIDQPWQGRSTWNWAAMSMTFSWLLYRKLWVHAFFYFLLPCSGLVALALISAQLEDSIFYAALTGETLYLLFIFGLLPKLANHHYHGHCLRKLKRAREVSSNTQEQEAWLARHGGTTSPGAVSIVTVLAIVATTLAYESVHAVGERRVALKKIYLNMQTVTQGVSDYYSFHQLLPESSQDIAAIGSLPGGISELKYDRRNGIITATLTISGLEGKHMAWTPSTPQYIELQWTCSSPDVSDFYLPLACRSQPHRSPLR
jgi:hypothetical protein